jgi:hypothetical protein
VGKTDITRSAVADYTAPAPMGSPCNTFGNEPPSQAVPAAQPAGSALPAAPSPNCTSQPGFWAAIEGPGTDKVQGDRFMTTPCSSTSTYQCPTNSKNAETRPEGYFWAVHVEPLAVNTAITVQVYDPAFMFTSITCDNSTLTPESDFPTYTGVTAPTSYLNAYASTDANDRYSDLAWTKRVDGNNVNYTNPDVPKYCSGDYNPGASSAPDPPVTSFALRHAKDPKNATAYSSCTKQFVGTSSPPTIAELTQWSNAARTTKSAAYNLQKAQLFHQWYDLCTFTPDVPGDYYLQVRTNVAVGGTAVANINPNNDTKNSLIYTGNTAVTAAAGNTTAGVGLNSFALRAVPSDTSKRQYIAVAGNESMPILQNKSGSAATFNLIRALPGTKNQYIAFDFFDGGDGANGSTNATVKVIAPTDSTGSVKATANVPGCKHAKNSEVYTDATNCTVNMRNATHNGQLEHIVIPIPGDYNCNPATLGGCWFSVTVTFPSGSDVTDFTTWTANIGGDPVRLIE